MIKGAAQYYRFAVDVGYVSFKTIKKTAPEVQDPENPLTPFYKFGEQHVNTVLGPDGVADDWFNQPLDLLPQDNHYDSIDSSYSTGISVDQRYLPLLTYNLFKDPSLVKGADFAWASGLWRFMTPVSHELQNQIFTEVLSPSSAAAYVNYESQYLTPSSSDWLLGDFTPKAITFNTWTNPKYAGFRGVLKSYWPTDCVPIATSLAATAISKYAAFKTKLSISDLSNSVDDCTDSTSAELVEDENFRGPFYFSTSA